MNNRGAVVVEYVIALIILIIMIAGVAYFLGLVLANQSEKSINTSKTVSPCSAELPSCI